MKRWILALTVLLCALALTACAAPAETPEAEEALPAETAEEATGVIPQPGSQDMAISAYGQILESFGALPPDDPGYPGYAEEFGNAYYEDGYLYICLTDNSPEMQEKYRALVDTPQILQFKEVAYSYNDLYALQMAIVQTEGLVFASVGVNVIENRGDIGIPDITKEAEMLTLITESLPADVAARFSEYPIAFQEEALVSVG